MTVSSASVKVCDFKMGKTFCRSNGGIQEYMREPPVVEALHTCGVLY